MLYLFRGMYGEAVTALPMNGGSYNVLINTTSKAMASFAATLAMVSYLATGVVSATTAIDYLSKVRGPDSLRDEQGGSEDRVSVSLSRDGDATQFSQAHLARMSTITPVFRGPL